MAELSRDGDELVLGLTALEKTEAVHGDIRVPWASVRSIDVVDNVIETVHGLKFPGTRWPGRFAIGTLIHASDSTTFAVVHHDTPRGVRVELDGGRYGELIVGCDDPEAVKARLGASS